MFDFLLDMGTYESRKVARFEKGDLRISTAAVSDGSRPFETAVAHPSYNQDKWVIVESYDTKAEAKKGHERWVKRMTAKKLPAQLTDCANAEIAQFADALRGRKKVALKRDLK